MRGNPEIGIWAALELAHMGPNGHKLGQKIPLSIPLWGVLLVYTKLPINRTAAVMLKHAFQVRVLVSEMFPLRRRRRPEA